MTRKDYVLIARALRESKEAATPEQQGALVDLTERLTVALKEDNPRFAAGTFRAAAGWE